MRLDDYLSKNNLVESRNKAQDLILRGFVEVNGIVTKTKSFNVKDDDFIKITQTSKFVSRGGEKLEHALISFNIDVKELTALDIGASTGGFTDCLLKYNAKKVYALDVGHNQLASKLRDDERVISIEHTNAKDIKKSMFDDPPSIIVSDVSFISVSKIAPIIREELPNFKYWISLIKPQFEFEKHFAGKNGVIKSDSLRKNILEDALNRISNEGFINTQTIESPLKGKEGNTEYLACFVLK